MNCVICKEGITKTGEATVTLERNGVLIIIKNVPADICDACGEYYLTEKVAAYVFKKAEEAIKSGAEIEILRYAA